MYVCVSHLSKVLCDKISDRVGALLPQMKAKPTSLASQRKVTNSVTDLVANKAIACS